TPCESQPGDLQWRGSLGKLRDGVRARASAIWFPERLSASSRRQIDSDRRYGHKWNEQCRGINGGAKDEYTESCVAFELQSQMESHRNSNCQCNRGEHGDQCVAPGVRNRVVLDHDDRA